MKRKITKSLQKGTATPALLVIASAFIIIIYGLLFVLSLQFNYSHRQIASDRALHIAEAGIDYYTWHLTQDPDDFQDGTGAPGPYEHEYRDPEGNVIGSFSLEITPPSDSSQIVNITSTGWTNQYPRVKRKVTARYGQLSLTNYAFLHNSNVWFSDDITINGPAFSNGGIRMDGTNTSTVESAKETYICGLDTGCNTPEEKPGVWGKGEDSTLWDFPVASIDFSNILVDFNKMKNAAQNDGLYLEPSGVGGYHIVFSDDGTFTVYRVDTVEPIKGYSLEGGCENLYQRITSEVAIGTYSVSDYPIIFSEDTAWIDGTVNGRATVVAVRFPVGSYETNIWVVDNIKYLEKNGDHALGIVAENDIVMGVEIPEEFEINGGLLAQNGKIIRHHYGYFGCRSATGQDNIKNEFTLYGSLISNLRSYWNFSSGPGTPASGFVNSYLDYDPDIIDNPPPYFPSEQYQFISWKEVK